MVVSRLLSEFTHVTSSEEGGRRYVQGIIEQLRAIRQAGQIPVDVEYLKRLKRAQDGAIYVCFEDWNSPQAAYLGTAVIPGEPLFFHYSSTAHEEAGRRLLLRCAKALDYDIIDT